MKKSIKILALSLCLYTSYSKINLERKDMNCRINSISDVEKIFPTSVKEIEEVIKKTENIVQDINLIINTPTKEQTFNNTFRALDNLSDKIQTNVAVLSVLQFLNPKKELRDKAQEGIEKLENLMIQEISTNKKLYEALEKYTKNNLKKECLSQEEQYFLDETMSDFKRSGLHLHQKELDKIKEVKQELAKLNLQFETNINQDNSKIEVNLEELKGVPERIIDSLEKTKNGKYILKTDYPTVFGILDFCEVENTRKKISQLFNNRAYPANKDVLSKIINKRDELAKLLGFKSYSELDLDDQMAKNTQVVKEFIDNLSKKSKKKGEKEIKEFLSIYPNKSELVDKNGKIQPWNTKFLKNYYKKHKLNLDEKLVAEYFPVENTIKELLDIYEQFLSVKFKEVKVNLWDKECQLLEVYKNNKLIGYLILDLFPRDNKYSHAANLTIVHAIKGCPCLTLVMANFPKATPNNPALLTFNDVNTFFHEFGHAMHSILGSTEIASFSGTSVKRDFVEMPSQMLENWLSDKKILKKISKHYKTGKPLTDNLIEALSEIEKFDAGDFISRQLSFAKLSQKYFDEGKNKDILKIFEETQKETSPYVAYDENSKMPYSFGHLSGYGAKYYGYMWSKVFAADLFEKIKKGGLLDPKTGQEYIDKVIGKGGSKDPNELLKDFLGREPKQDAFYKQMGLE